ncbi:MAG TPA: hypothetical protein VGB16_00990 [candidate division Zixibacteria bacterium]
MKILVFVFLISACMVASAYGAGEIKKEFSVSEGGKLDIGLNSGGSIDVRGWDKQLVSIGVDFVHCSAEDFIFDFSADSSTIKVRSDYKRHVNNSNIEVDIMVPREFNLKLKTAGGSVSVYNVNGKIEGNTAGGSLDLKNLTGHIDLVTGGGSIIVKDSKLDGEVRTGGGSVLVENVEGDFDAHSGGGNVVYKNVKTPSRVYSVEQVYIRNAGGDLNVDDAPNGADISTGGGNIHIRSAKAFVRANTGGGNISIDSVDGSAEASTGAGEIEVTVISNSQNGKGDITLTSGTGNITLTLPRYLSMDVDVELAYTKEHENRYRIISDFNLQQETTNDWDTSHGTPRKYIRGKTVLKDGQNKIVIRTVNGNVTLRQGK